MTREISDKEAFRAFKKVMDKEIVKGKKVKEIIQIQLTPNGHRMISLEELHKHMKKEAEKKDKTKVEDSIGREELDKWKEWIKYKIKKGRME